MKISNIVCFPYKNVSASGDFTSLKIVETQSSDTQCAALEAWCCPHAKVISQQEPSFRLMLAVPIWNL